MLRGLMHGCAISSASKRANLAAPGPATGVLLRVEVMPGKRLRGTYIDAAQAQKKAKGELSAPPALSPEQYKKELLSAITTIFLGGVWGVQTCDEEQRQNPLRKTSLFALENLNGFKNYPTSSPIPSQQNEIGIALPASPGYRSGA